MPSPFRELKVREIRIAREPGQECLQECLQEHSGRVAPSVAPSHGASGQNLSLSDNCLGIIGIPEAARTFAVTP